MDQKIVAVILLTVLTVSICATVTTSLSERPIFFSDFQTINSLHPQLAVSLPIVIGTSLHSNSTQPLDQPTRLEIYKFVKTNPGVHFRGICDTLDLSVGVVQYHLSVLEHAGVITEYTDGQNKRYFEHSTFTERDMKLISLVRHKTTAKILIILAQDGSALHKNIAHSLRISSQALTWQMNQLKETGLINAEKSGINVKYSLNEENQIKAVLNLTNTLKVN